MRLFPDSGSGKQFRSYIGWGSSEQFGENRNKNQIRVPQCDSESVSSRQRARGSLKRTAAGPAASRVSSDCPVQRGRNKLATTTRCVLQNRLVFFSYSCPQPSPVKVVLEHSWRSAARSCKVIWYSGLHSLDCLYSNTFGYGLLAYGFYSMIASVLFHTKHLICDPL